MTNPADSPIDVLLREIEEQPAVLSRVLEGPLSGQVRALARAVKTADPHTVVFVARGSSDNAAVYGRYLFETCNGALTALAAPSTLTLYGRAPRLSGTLVLGVSQSGRGEDVVAYLREAREQGALTAAIVNDVTSPLAEAAEWVLDCAAGPELSIPATKTVTAQMAVLALLSAEMAGGPDGREGLVRVVEEVEQALGQRAEAAELAGRIAGAEAGLASVIGRGMAFPAALEIALKLKETSYTHAEPFSGADFLHGPLALVDASYASLLVDVGGRSTEAAIDAARAIRDRGGRAFLVRASEGSIDPEVPALVLRAPGLSELYSPIVVLVLGQLLAVELACAKGLDPAQPRGLKKVTSTR